MSKKITRRKFFSSVMGILTLLHAPSYLKINKLYANVKSTNNNMILSEEIECNLPKFVAEEIVNKYDKKKEFMGIMGYYRTFQGNNSEIYKVQVGIGKKVVLNFLEIIVNKPHDKEISYFRAFDNGINGLISSKSRKHPDQFSYNPQSWIDVYQISSQDAKHVNKIYLQQLNDLMILITNNKK